MIREFDPRDLSGVHVRKHYDLQTNTWVYELRVDMVTFAKVSNEFYENDSDAADNWASQATVAAFRDAINGEIPSLYQELRFMLLRTLPDGALSRAEKILEEFESILQSPKKPLGVFTADEWDDYLDKRERERGEVR